MGMQRGNFNSALTAGLIDKWFSTQPIDLTPQFSRFFQVLSSDKAFERNATITGFSSMSAKDEDGPVLLDTASEKDKSFYEHTTFALGFAVSMEMMEDGGAMADIARYTNMLKRAAAITKEILAVRRINNASSTSYTMKGNDGAALASASHPTVSGNQSNILSSGADISEAAFEAIRVQVKRAKDARGLSQQLELRSLIVSPEQEADCHRILKSQLQVDQAGSNRNFLLDTSTIKDIIVSNYVTSTTQWQITTNAPDGLKFYIRKEAQIDKDNVFLTAQGIYRAIMRISEGYDDWRGIYFSL